MSIKREIHKSNNGFISLEVMISTVFLVIMILFSVKMFDNQKIVIQKANQNVEITNIMFELRKSLLGKGCTENFAGLKENSGFDVISYLKMISSANGEEIIRQIYPSNQRIEGLKTELKIKSYHLSQGGLGHRTRSGRTFFVVNFDRGKGIGVISKEIKVYTKGRDRVIESCSLAPMSNSSDYWMYKGDYLQSGKNTFFIGSKMKVGTVNLGRGLFVKQDLVTCGQKMAGSIYWSDEKSEWFFCSKSGEISLKDQRSFKEAP